MQIAQAAAAEQTTEETVVDPAAAALAEAAAKAPTTTEEALLAKAEAERTAQRPSGLPEKFSSWEDMAKAYAELEAKQSAPKEEAPVDADAEAAAAAEAAEAEAKAKEAEDAAPKAVDLKSLTDEFQTAGALSEASYADLAAKGFDKATVDQFIAGQQLLADAATKRITDEAGGEENIQRMFAWASTAMTPAEIDTYNASFANADVNAAVLAMGQLKAKYEAANGKTGKLLEGKGASATVDTYGSWAEVTVDMGDPRYRADPAFRAKVEAKMARSKNL